VTAAIDHAPRIVVGLVLFAYGALHVFWGGAMYRFYRRSRTLSWLNQSTEGAMRFHGGILMAIGAGVALWGVASG
jgi:hypothetical protein